MSFHSEDAAKGKMEEALKRAEESAYYSAYHECNVVIFKCANCEEWYEEEKEAAKARIRGGEKTVCIRCDSDAEERSVTAVRVREIWYLL